MMSAVASADDFVLRGSLAESAPLMIMMALLMKGSRKWRIANKMATGDSSGLRLFVY